MFRQAAVLAGSLVTLLAPMPATAQDPALRLELVQKQGDSPYRDLRLVTSRDGYLLVLHVSSGSVRVMFPTKPGAASGLSSGEYDLDRLGTEMPWANGRGAGIIVAAWSPTPIRTGDFVRYGHWAVSDLSRRAFTEDPAAATIALMTRLGATPGAAATVEYGSVAAPRVSAPPQEVAVRVVRQDRSDNQVWLVYENLFRIQGICPWGTRDVTGARESCSSPEDLSRRTPYRPTSDMPPPAPAEPPRRPIYTPPPASPPPPAVTSRPATPPPSGGRKGKQLY